MSIKILLLLLLSLISCDLNKALGNDQHGYRNTPKEEREYYRTNIKYDSYTWMFAGTLYSPEAGTPLVNLSPAERMAVGVTLAFANNGEEATLTSTEIGYTFDLAGYDQALDKESLQVRFDNDDVYQLTHKRYAIRDGEDFKFFYGSHPNLSSDPRVSVSGVFSPEAFRRMALESFIIVDKTGNTMHRRTVTLFGHLCLRAIEESGI